jgi:uncharacterized membrane protein YraQ (UPF0718 family)
VIHHAVKREALWFETFINFIYIILELTVLFIAISFVISLLQGYIPYEKIEKKLAGKNGFSAAFGAIGFTLVQPLELLYMD